MMRRIEKWNQLAHRWQMFATKLPFYDLYRNVTAMRIVRSMTQAKHHHMEYLKHKALSREAHASQLRLMKKLEAMGLYDSDDDEDDDEDSDDESWEDIVKQYME